MAVQADDYALEVGLDVSEEGLLDLVERPGKYRLDVLDSEGAFLHLSCWVLLKAAGGRYPAPQSALEAVNVDLMRTFSESMQAWSASNTQIAGALARSAGGGTGGAKRPIPGLDDADDPESIRELLNNAIRASREGTAEPEVTTPEDTARKAQAAKVWLTTIVDVLSESGPKALPMLQTLGAWLKSNKPGLPPVSGA